jgi:hypothetical protein
MSEFEHLDATSRQMMQAPAAERICFCREDRWVAHPAAKQAQAQIEELYHYPRTLRMPNLLLVGRSGNGKSSILKHFANRFEATVDEGGYPSVPVLSVEVPPAPTLNSFYSAILFKLKSGHRERDSQESKRQQVVALLRHMKVRMLLLDEFNNVAEAGRDTRDLLSAVRSLANDLQIAICAAGTKTAINALNQDPQLKSRFQPIALPGWKFGGTYRSFLASYERMLPLEKPSNLAEKELAFVMYTKGGGAIGETVKLLKNAAAHAISTGEERITVELLTAVPWTSETQWSDVPELI